MKNLTRYGTYGFLSLLLAAQMEMLPKETKGSSLGNKKSIKAVKKDLKRSSLPKAA